MKVDAIVSVFGKPFQTLATLKSLYKHSGQHIDKLFFLEEATHPFNDEVKWVMEHFSNVVHYKPRVHINPYTIPSYKLPYENIRHQYGIENSDKEYVFITHNDVLYTGDIIGEMLDEIGRNVGIGEIGQCWNCPAKAKGLCSGETFYDWWPTYEEVLNLDLPHIRTKVSDINKEHPKPLPECRLNEWACLINRKACVKEGRPYFGEFDNDSGTAWFKAMHLKGYKFKDYRRNFHHAYWANAGGYNVQKDISLYLASEIKAERWLKENFNI